MAGLCIGPGSLRITETMLVSCPVVTVVADMLGSCSCGRAAILDAAVELVAVLSRQAAELLWLLTS